MREMHNPKTCLSEQKFEVVLPGSNMAQSVAVLYQTWIFVSGDSKCSFRVVFNRSIMLLSMLYKLTRMVHFFFGKRISYGRPYPKLDIV